MGSGGRGGCHVGAVLAELLPAVTGAEGVPSAQAVQWSGAEPTLGQLEQGLSGLVADAPDEGRRTTATALAEGLAGVRAAVATDLELRTGASAIPADDAALEMSAAAVQAARDRLAAAIAMASPPPES